MNLNELWQKIDDEEKSKKNEFEVIDLKKMQSINPLLKLKKKIGINICYGILVCPIYIFLIVNYFNIWQVSVLLSIVLIVSIYIIVIAFKIYKNISPMIGTKPLLIELEKIKYQMDKWMKNQKLIGIFIYPIGATGGFILGGSIGSGKPVNEFMNNTFTIITLLVSIVALTIVCSVLVKWMFNYSFGNYLKKLQSNIDSLKENKVN